jgi:hypothetical protein
MRRGVAVEIVECAAPLIRQARQLPERSCAHLGVDQPPRFEKAEPGGDDLKSGGGMMVELVHHAEQASHEVIETALPKPRQFFFESHESVIADFRVFLQHAVGLSALPAQALGLDQGH